MNFSKKIALKILNTSNMEIIAKYNIYPWRIKHIYS